ncbi:MAG TPA: formate dehydrogenase subunit gamma [Candidatus Angelobacter sp.]|nr:formate dehydrogenase subunit gamma [Candidatus Angelobacter sp.]
MSSISVPREETTVPAGEVLRYNFKERLCHWLNGAAYVYCLLTGLAFDTPYLFWLASIFGGGATARFWHPWSGLVFFGATLWMHALWKPDMAPIPEDREWNRNIQYYVTNQDDRVPPQGRFNAGQKTFYWAMFYSAIVLLATGLIMWFPEKMPRDMHWLLTVVTFIHSATALITIGAFIIHIYMGVFMVPGGLRGMTTGHVPERWAKFHHPLWYRKIRSQR